jgi:MOSC domain-containing protein YiiM
MGKIGQISVSDGGVPKLPVAQAEVSASGLSGDRQANLKYHGGPDRALCLWSQEIIEALQQQGHPIAPGSAGENVTIAGLPWEQVTPGTELALGDSVRLQITDYAAPCRKNGRWFSDRRYSRMSQKHYPGSSRVYARVLTAGTIAQGDRVQLYGPPISGSNPV